MISKLSHSFFFILMLAVIENLIFSNEFLFDIQIH